MGNIGANIGEKLAVAMAEGGLTIANAACRYTNLTDACCIAGIRFPREMDAEYRDLLIWFANRTRWMGKGYDDRAEHTAEARYCLIGEMLVKMLEGVGADNIKEEIEDKIKGLDRKIKNAEHRGHDRYSDRYGFDECSTWLYENNWGDCREYDEREDCNYWTRRVS